MGILDNARYAELGKKAEAKKLANDTVALIAPHIEKEAIRKFAPVIQRQAIEKLLMANNNMTGDHRGLSQLQLIQGQ